MRFVSSLFSFPINWALPSRCPICGVIVAENYQFCVRCWQKMDFISEPWCSSCGIPFTFDPGAHSVCVTCLDHPPDHDGVRAAVAYDENSGRIAMDLKYSGKLGLASLIAQHLEKYLGEYDSDTIIVPVPLHRMRLWQRGFNQSVLISNILSARSGIAHENNVLVRHTATPPLRSMNEKQRQKLVGHALSLHPKKIHQVAGRTVLLVDDVYTTGATTNACARLLKSVGAQKVVVFCWARVISDRQRL